MRREMMTALSGLILGAAALAHPAMAQVVATQNDPLGYGIPYPFAHLSQGPAGTPGTSTYLLEHDPFALYLRGRDLVQRVFTQADGAMLRPGEPGGSLYLPSNSETTLVGPSRLRRDHAASCGLCHATPFAEPGSGPVIASTGPRGRDTPHFFGAGLVEMIGGKIRDAILETCDRSGRGFITKDVAVVGCRALVTPSPGVAPIDFGDILPDGFGIPRLNSAIRLWWVNAEGHAVEGSGLNEPGVAGFDFAVSIFGWGRGTRTWPDGRVTSEGGEAATLREFIARAADEHIGIGTQDPIQIGDRRARGPVRGKAGVSLLGARQFDLGAFRPPYGDAWDPPSPRRLSFGAGDIDAFEFYLLHLPPPAMLLTDQGRQGKVIFTEIGCAGCHTETWHIEKDRRRFSLEPVTAGDGRGGSRVELRLSRSSKANKTSVRAFSDFRHWDIGPAFHELRFDGTVQMEHRTAPLWGVGTTAPYGHDGRFGTLEQVIDAHAGAATESARAFSALQDRDRKAVIAFLHSQQLYATLETPADIDGDGIASEDFRLRGIAVGREVFQPRYLLAGGLDVGVVCCVSLPDGGLRPLFKPRASSAAWGAPMLHHQGTAK